MFKSDSINKISAALLKAQKEMGLALKDSKNPFFKSKYADLNSIREAVTPALHANGITLLQPVNGDNVETLLLHESGEYLGSVIKIVSKEEHNAQAYGSAISYARRYGLSSMLSVGTEDDDGETAMVRQPAVISRVGKPVAAVPAVTQQSTAATNSSNTQSFGSFRKGSN